MKLPVPGLGAAANGVRELTEAVTGIPDATARAMALLPRVEALITRIEGIADGAERTLARADGAIDQVEATAKRADASINSINTASKRAQRSIDDIDVAAKRAAGSIDDIDAAMRRADGAMSRIDQLFERTSALLGTAGELTAAYAGPLGELAPDAAKLVPALRRVASTVSEQEVDAVVGLIDQLPQLLETLRGDVLPLLHRIGPDVHETMEIVDDVRHIINGLPGARLFRRRGEEAAEEEAEQEAEDERNDRSP